MGIVVEETIAKRSSCHGFKVGDKLMLTSKGVIGVLSEDQEKKYCPDLEDIVEKTPEVPQLMAKRFILLRLISNVLDKCNMEESEDGFLHCVKDNIKEIIKEN